MKLIHRITTLATLSTMLFALPAMAADGKHVVGDHHKSKYGGVLQEVKEVQYELVAKSDSIAIFVEDHGKKVDSKGATAKVTLLTGKEKSEVMLLPAGENKLQAIGKFDVKSGTKVVSVVTLAGKSGVTARFVVP
ncbi:MAG: hypothetical protein H7232_12985 [Aeromicrobium sp.]|nr:hypothetical protein [Burkholderiales bacterium]